MRDMPPGVFAYPFMMFLLANAAAPQAWMSSPTRRSLTSTRRARYLETSPLLSTRRSLTSISVLLGFCVRFLFLLLSLQVPGFDIHARFLLLA